MKFFKFFVAHLVILFSLAIPLSVANSKTVENTSGGTVQIISKDLEFEKEFTTIGSIGETFEKRGLDITSYRTEDDTAVDPRLKLAPEENLVIFEKSVSKSFEQIELDYSVKTVENNTMLVGTERVVQRGIKGLAVKTVISTKNRTTETSETMLTVLDKPVSEIIEIGTKETLDTLPKVWKPGDSMLAEDTQKLRAVLYHEFPELVDIGGYRPCDATGEHCTGRALDIMIPDYKNNQQLGEDVKEWLIEKNDEEVIDMCWIIWDHSFFEPPTYNRIVLADRGNDTTNHYDHIHLFLKDSQGKCSRVGHEI